MPYIKNKETNMYFWDGSYNRGVDEERLVHLAQSFPNGSQSRKLYFDVMGYQFDVMTAIEEGRLNANGLSEQEIFEKIMFGFSTNRYYDGPVLDPQRAYDIWQRLSQLPTIVHNDYQLYGNHNIAYEYAPYDDWLFKDYLPHNMSWDRDEFVSAVEHNAISQAHKDFIFHNNAGFIEGHRHR